MIIDATFWVGISFVLFFAGLIYLKVPQKVNEILNNLISNIKNEIDESEKLRTEAKILLDKSQIKLESAQNESKKIIDEAKKESENLIIEMNDKFHKASEIKKNLAKNKISHKITECARKVQAKEIPLQDLAFNVMISKAPRDYTKTVPQHIRAAKQLESIREIKKGDIISYVKILNKPGVRPIEMARKSEIDPSKYMEFMESTLDQLTSSMDLDFDTILGKPKQTGLEQFFWN